MNDCGVSCNTFAITSSQILGQIIVNTIPKTDSTKPQQESAKCLPTYILINASLQLNKRNTSDEYVIIRSDLCIKKIIS